ncbi:hypothetical protein BDV98DRAFT_605746 [Pterulicium gracile]|uniref:Uncharacterized protein n=1 Tax=Pterulicium gracile TaxID=1884261 RepID=A0A5C3QCY8_9AGAR|nr:hypothetical protein BDV98DRAFT_605746 [Pterula gracilis]
MAPTSSHLIALQTGIYLIQNVNSGRFIMSNSSQSVVSVQTYDATVDGQNPLPDAAKIKVTKGNGVFTFQDASGTNAYLSDTSAIVGTDTSTGATWAFAQAQWHVNSVGTRPGEYSITNKAGTFCLKEYDDPDTNFYVTEATDKAFAGTVTDTTETWRFLWADLQ